MTRRIVHVMPYDGVGGVEQAAASAEGAARGALRLERFFVFEAVRDRSGRAATFSPGAMWAAAGRLKRRGPDLIVLSLWRPVIVWALARLRGCRAPMVLFLHNAEDAHLADRWLTRMAARRAVAIWADSRVTLERRLPIPKGLPARVISYLVSRRAAVRGESPDPAPRFVFWGRLAAQKDPLRALSLFERIRAVLPEARFALIGPDGGLRGKLEAEIARRGLGEAIRLLGPMDRAGIEAEAAQASFYLQTSRYEGMALSVMEAMQAGLVPVVTPVGEIARYTADGESAIWVDSEDAAAEAVRILIAAPDRWRRMRARALANWSDQPLYADDILAAAQEALDGRAGEGAP